MDPQQCALPLQLHGNSFAMGSGQVPKLSAGEGGGGGGGDGGAGGGQEAQPQRQNMTSSSSSAGVSSRLSPGKHSECPLEPQVHCHAKGRLDVKSGSCGLLTICRSGVMFPWMNPRTADSQQSGGGGRLATRRERAAFTNRQLLELEKEFHFSPYLCRPRRLEMAAGLKLTDRQVKNWFQNRRMRYKKEHKGTKVAGASQWSACEPSFRLGSCEDLMSIQCDARTSAAADQHFLDYTAASSSLFCGGQAIHSADFSQLSYVLPSVANGPAVPCAAADSHHHAGISNWP